MVAQSESPDVQARSPSLAAVSVVICSRNRQANLRRAVEALVAADPRVTELLIIDQSDQVAPIAPPWPRGFRHLALPSVGLSRARNVALRLATGDVVFFTDDDCLVQRDAVERCAEMLACEPGLAVVFGSVQARCAEQVEGFIPTYTPRQRRVLRGRLGKLRDGGIGACMAVRRDLALAAGGFDERLGPGTEIPACEDGEFAYRMLKQGYGIGHRPDALVMHEGLKRWCDGPAYAYQTFRSISIAYAMHLRSGDPVAALLLIQQFSFAVADMALKLGRGRKPTGMTRIRGLLAGMTFAFMAGRRLSPRVAPPRESHTAPPAQADTAR